MKSIIHLILVSLNGFVFAQETVPVAGWSGTSTPKATVISVLQTGPTVPDFRRGAWITPDLMAGKTFHPSSTYSPDLPFFLAPADYVSCATVSEKLVMIYPTSTTSSLDLSSKSWKSVLITNFDSTSAPIRRESAEIAVANHDTVYLVTLGGQDICNERFGFSPFALNLQTLKWQKVTYEGDYQYLDNFSRLYQSGNLTFNVRLGFVVVIDTSQLFKINKIRYSTISLTGAESYLPQHRGSLFYDPVTYSLFIHGGHVGSKTVNTQLKVNMKPFLDANLPLSSTLSVFSLRNITLGLNPTSQCRTDQNGHAFSNDFILWVSGNGAPSSNPCVLNLPFMYPNDITLQHIASGYMWRVPYTGTFSYADWNSLVWQNQLIVADSPTSLAVMNFNSYLPVNITSRAATPRSSIRSSSSQAIDIPTSTVPEFSKSDLTTAVPSNSDSTDDAPSSWEIVVSETPDSFNYISSPEGHTDVPTTAEYELIIPPESNASRASKASPSKIGVPVISADKRILVIFVTGASLLIVFLTATLLLLRKERWPTFGRKSTVAENDITHFSDMNDAPTQILDHTTEISSTSHTVTSTGFQSTMVPSEMGLSVPGYLMCTGEDFKIEKELAKGGFGIVYLASATKHDLMKHGHKIVVKVMTGDRDEQEKHAFLQEVATMAYFSRSDNIVKLLGFTQKPDCILMKYYPQGSLDKFLHSPKIIKTKVIIMGLILDIANGLFSMHEKKFAHCDIKAHNIILDYDYGRKRAFCVLTDFGLTKPISNDVLTVKAFKPANLRGGSLLYAAPELFRSLRNEKGVACLDVLMFDIYALGVLIFEITTRKKPILSKRPQR